MFAAFSLISTVCCEIPAAQSRLSSDDFKKSAIFSVCHHFLQPKATRTIFDLEAGMSFWALDYQNPAHFNVVSILTEKGHCYRLNNLRQCKKETVCVRVPGWRPDPFGNGLIHLAGKWENRDDYLWHNLFSFERSRTDDSLQTPVHLPGMLHRKKGCD